MRTLTDILRSINLALFILKDRSLNTRDLLIYLPIDTSLFATFNLVTNQDQGY